MEGRAAGRAVPTEFKLLRFFLENTGRVLGKAQILDHVWNYDFGGDANVVESYVSYLRRGGHHRAAAAAHLAGRRVHAAAAADLTPMPASSATAAPLWRRGTDELRRLYGRIPLRIQLVAGLLLLVVLALGAAGTAAAASLRGYLLERVDGQLQQAVRPFAGGARTSGADGDREDGPRLPSQFYLALLDPTGGVLAVRSNPLQGTDSAPTLPRLTVNEALARSGRPFTVDASGGAAPWRVVAAPFSDGSGSVVVAQSLSDVGQTVDQLVLLQLVIGAAVVLLLDGVAYVTVRRSLRPLTEVEHTAAAIAAGDLSRRVPDRDRRTEVGRLSAALNGMLHQIESAFRVQQASEASEERMRRFVADASHDAPR